MGLRLLAPLLALALLPLGARGDAPGSPEDRFREATAQARAGDLPRALQLYGELAAAGHESASLYWNWAQAAQARGAAGEALWALLRAREIEPGDRALPREIERLRETANLDLAEVSPEPFQALARLGRRFHLGLVALALLAVALALHAAARWLTLARWPVAAAWVAGLLGLLAATPPLLGSLARPVGVVVVRGAGLLDSASPGASALGTLREGEVVPLLERSGEYLRVEDSSGARGWARLEDVRPLERPAR